MRPSPDQDRTASHLRVQSEAGLLRVDQRLLRGPAGSSVHGGGICWTPDKSTRSRRALAQVPPLGDSRPCFRAPAQALPCPQGTLTGQLDPMACGPGQLPSVHLSLSRCYVEDWKHSLLQGGRRFVRPKANVTHTVQKVQRLIRPLPEVVKATLSGEWRLSSWPSCLRCVGNSQHGSFLLSHHHAGVGFLMMQMPLRHPCSCK